jgi:hypothetical protein
MAESRVLGYGAALCVNLCCCVYGLNSSSSCLAGCCGFCLLKQLTDGNGKFTRSAAASHEGAWSALLMAGAQLLLLLKHLQHAEKRVENRTDTDSTNCS